MNGVREVAAERASSSAEDEDHSLVNDVIALADVSTHQICSAQRNVDHKNAALPRDVVHSDIAALRPNGFPSNGESKS